jgi:putative ATPase
MMREEGYGANYEYDHDSPEAFSGQSYWPDSLSRQKFYKPVERGFEREIAKRIDYWDRLRKERGDP